MKIKSIKIMDYGPIKDFILTPSNFEIIFGLNESGKTAIVEALSYILFKKSPTGLRYGKPEHISIEIEEANRIHALPTKKLNIELPAGDVANLLYVQTSESSIYGAKGEASFWDGVKAMLSKISEGVTFTKLDSKIFDAVGLTPKRSDWQENKQHRIQNEENRRDELGMYLRKIGEIEKKEIELSKLVEKNELLKKDLKEIENYKNYKTYQELLNLHNAYLEKKIALQEFERYKHEYLAYWQELEVKKKSRLGDEKKLKEEREEIVNLKKEREELAKTSITIEAHGLKSCLTMIPEEREKVPIVYPILTVAMIIVTLVLFLLSRVPKPVISILFIISVLPSIFFLYKKHKAKELTKEENNCLAKGEKIFPDISSLPELADAIKKFEENKTKNETLLEVKTKFIEHFSREKTVAIIEKEISDIRNKTGLAEISDLKVKLNKKRVFEEEQSKLNIKILTVLHEKDDKKWDRLIRAMKTAKSVKAPDLALEKDVKDESANLRERINALTSEIKIFKAVHQTKFNITNDRSAFIEYDHMVRKLKNYDLEKKAALTARNILNEMSSELDEYIQDIIKGEESLSEYFKLITERYDEVEVKNKDFVVKETSGRKFKIDELSSGTQDQLLFCFRIAALKKIYPQGSFLILDDAFIFADWERRKRLGVLLKKFVEEGNQVIYLTSDDHTRDLFKELGAKITTL